MDASTKAADHLLVKVKGTSSSELAMTAGGMARGAEVVLQMSAASMDMGLTQTARTFPAPSYAIHGPRSDRTTT